MPTGKFDMENKAQDLEDLLKQMNTLCQGANLEDVLSCTVTMCAFSIYKGYPPEQHKEIINGIARIMKSIIKNEAQIDHERTTQ